MYPSTSRHCKKTTCLYIYTINSFLVDHKTTTDPNSNLHSVSRKLVILLFNDFASFTDSSMRFFIDW